MKNLIICLLFSCSFLFTSTTIASELGGVTEYIIVAPKTGQTVYSFELPKEYQHKDNVVEITLTDGKGNTVHSMVSKDFTITLPPTVSGTINITVKVDSLVFTQQITL